MALRGCFGCLKFLVFIINFLFWLIGLGVMAVSLWLLFDQQLYLQSIGADQSDYFVGTYIILGVGMLMTLVGFLGCCGAWKESTWMLGTFFVFLVVIFIGEVAVGLLVYFQEAPYQELIRHSVHTTVTKKYHANSTTTTQIFDSIQEALQCCGSDGPLDWSVSIYNGYIDSEAPEIGIPKSEFDSGIPSQLFNIPTSCCEEDVVECTSLVHNVETDRIPKGVYTKGCTEKMILFFEDHVVYLVALTGCVFVIQLIGMIFSMCLCCAVKKIEDFKA